MTFPLTVFNQTFSDAPAFAEAVLADATIGGGRFKPDTLPHQWLNTLLQDKTIERDFLVGLAAWLCRSSRAAGISESVAIAQSLEFHELAPVFAAALDGLSLEMLLQPNPHQPELSIEDSLLTGLATLMDGSDDGLRKTTLERLRHAGLRNHEIQLLMKHGSANEILAGVPSILTETRPSPDIIAIALIREKSCARATCATLIQTPMTYRKSIWKQVCKTAPLMKKNKELKELLFS